MSATYHINAEDEFIAFSFADEVNLVDLYELLQALLKDPEFEPSWPQLIDLREVSFDLKSEAVTPFARFVATMYRPQVDGVIAIVLDDAMSAEVYAGIFRMTCSLTDTEVFDDYALAIKWLLRGGPDNSAGAPAQLSV